MKKVMKKDKDFRYYGKKRWEVQRILRTLDKQNKYDYSLLYCGICFVLAVLCVNLQKIFNVDLGLIGGVLVTICFMEFIWCLGISIIYIVCRYLDKYYWNKRVELFNKYMEEKKSNLIKYLESNE